jgi:transcriptional regulator with XRE-family HTH domain
VNIKAARIKKGIKQKDLADMVGVTQASVSLWETGSLIPSDTHIKKISKILEIGLVCPEKKIKQLIDGFSEESISKLYDYALSLKKDELQREIELLEGIEND